MERAGAAMLLPSGHPIHSFINDGMDLCVWLQILQVPVVRSISCRVLLLFLTFYFFCKFISGTGHEAKECTIRKRQSCNDEQFDCPHTVQYILTDKHKRVEYRKWRFWYLLESLDKIYSLSTPRYLQEPDT